MNLAIIHNGNVETIIIDAEFADWQDHIKNGYPYLLPYMAGLTCQEAAEGQTALPLLRDKTSAAQALSATDQGMARIVEDLISLLTAKGVFIVSELPQSAQDKLTARAEARAKLQGV